MPAARMQFRNNHVDTERVLQNRRGRSGRGPTGPASAGSWASGAKTVLYIAVGAFLGVYLMEVYPIFDPNTATVFTRARDGEASPILPPAPVSAFAPRALNPSNSKCPRVTLDSRRGGGAPLAQNVLNKALARVPAGNGAICALEVGTADGAGSTMALVSVLNNRCQSEGRAWTLYTYEGQKTEFRKASHVWRGQDGVHVINEMVLSRANLHKNVLPLIDAPPGSAYPGREHYAAKYKATQDLMQRGTLGGFLRTRPQCSRAGNVLDFVSIDSTRYTGIGILQTLLDEGLADHETVFAMENDNWKRSNGKADTAAEFVSRALPLSDLTHYVSGTSLMSHHHSLMSHHHPLSDLTHYVSGTSSLPQTPNPKP
eukprot:Tamp_19940.p1 GENE.Tamp_19940~~Tamp_19940.p1  ORF type:complete len:371 (-),score=27.54 Tamp_19940:73-1185(-)